MRIDEERSVEMRVGNRNGGTKRVVALSSCRSIGNPAKRRPPNTYLGHGLVLVTTVLASAN